MRSFAETPSVADIVAQLQSRSIRLGANMVKVLYNLASITNVAVQLHESNNAYVPLNDLVEHFRPAIGPYLTELDIATLREDLRSGLKSGDSFHSLYLLAANLGMHDELKQQVNGWKRDPRVTYYVTDSQAYIRQSDAISVMLGLGDSCAITAAAYRLNALLVDPEHIRGWLACTEFSALRWICFSILNQQSKKQHDLLQAFTQSVRAPDAAPYMLELLLSVRKPKLVREWLEDNLRESVVGLVSVAAGFGHEPIEISSDQLQKAAVDFLVSACRRGHEAFLQCALKQVDEQTLATIQSLVIDVAQVPSNLFDQDSTPQWLSERIAELTSRQKKLRVATKWVYAVDLPHLAIGDCCLTADQSQFVLEALKLSTLECPLTLVKQLKNEVTVASADAFVWALFERWLAEGADSQEKWAMVALGLLGSDDIALKLTPFIRKWPGESRHSWAVLGLACLRAIGSDTALMQINSIAQKVKYKGIKRRAQQCLENIATDRKLTTDQLGDRIIPDCGLDASGHRMFAFGPRQFHFVLGGDLKPFVRDGAGKLRANLPKPNQKDNADMAVEAIAAWKLFKKQVNALVKLQVARLEAAMIEERRWLLKDFQDLLVTHPLMMHLVQRVVWDGYDDAGERVATFRVAEDCSFADEVDAVVNVKGIAAVGVMHPVQLSPQRRNRWEAMLSNYEILPPFLQINRETYLLQPDEANVEEMTRFATVEVLSSTLARMMQGRGWLKGQIDDDGAHRVYWRYFKSADLTAVVGDYEHQYVFQPGAGDEDAMGACLFLEGYYPQLHEYPKKNVWYNDKLKIACRRLGEVSRVVMSEVLRDLDAVANTAIRS